MNIIDVQLKKNRANDFRNIAENTILAVFLVPQGIFFEDVRALQETVAHLSKSKFNLHFPPHITLRSGLSVPREQVSTVLEQLEQVVPRYMFSPVELEGFQFSNEVSFGQGFWIGIGVSRNVALQELFQSLESVASEYTDFPILKTFRPHISLALHDLDGEGYQKIKSYLATIDEEIYKGSQNFVLQILSSNEERKEWTVEREFQCNPLKQHES